MKEKGEIEAELALLEASTEKDLWLADLVSFEEVYGKMMKDFNDKNEIEEKASSKETGKAKKPMKKQATGMKIKVVKKTV